MPQAIRETLPPQPETDDGLAPVRKHLAKALRIGMVRGMLVFLGHDAPRSEPEGLLAGLARECIGQDILVVAVGRASRILDAAGLFETSDLEAAGSGLAEFCALCDLTPVVACPGQDTGPILALCDRLAGEFGVTASQLPVSGCGQDASASEATSLEILAEPLTVAETDLAAAAAVISRHITVRRLALGLNDRFDGSVYS